MGETVQVSYPGPNTIYLHYPNLTLEHDDYYYLKLRYLTAITSPHKEILSKHFLTKSLKSARVDTISNVILVLSVFELRVLGIPYLVFWLVLMFKIWRHHSEQYALSLRSVCRVPTSRDNWPFLILCIALTTLSKTSISTVWEWIYPRTVYSVLESSFIPGRESWPLGISMYLRI